MKVYYWFKLSRMLNILHLLFVDDILILSGASLSEWKVIQGILQDFCKASRMIINAQKSIIIHSGVNNDTLNAIKDVFTFPSKDLDHGFHYLGFFLKLDNYKATDWNWLIDKFEARIKHWVISCYLWVVTLVLLKVVLEIQPVYWLALAHVLISILNTICKICFAFLWSGVKNKKKYHLCSWMSIARPKSYGGWGFVTSFCSVDPWQQTLCGELL
jgi:hypothetical protein